MKEGLYMHGGKEEGPFIHNAIPLGSHACVVQQLAYTLNPPEIILLDKDDHDDEDAGTSTTLNDDYTNNDPIIKSAYINSNEDKMILGMKEIRFQDQDLIPWTPKEAFTFLQDHFPCARYVININTRYIYQSKTMKQHLKGKVIGLNRTQVQQKIQIENQFLVDLSLLLGNDTARLLHSDDWQKDVNVFNDVVDWLGFEDCSFDTLLHENRGGFSHDEETEVDVGEKCRYPF